MPGRRYQRDCRGWKPGVVVVGLLLLYRTLSWADVTELGDVAQGMRLYRYYCAPCHGLEGTGKRRDGEPPFMPWWGYTLTQTEIWSLVAFIRSLARGTME
jgi:mono/diheme cytochrome c family protein